MISKRVVIILIIFALIFATIAVALNVVASEKRVSTNLPDSKEDGNGKVGVTILPPTIEDKGNVSG
jgi:hypothetical protein